MFVSNCNIIDRYSVKYLQPACCVYSLRLYYLATFIDSLSTFSHSFDLAPQLLSFPLLSHLESCTNRILRLTLLPTLYNPSQKNRRHQPIFTSILLWSTVLCSVGHNVNVACFISIYAQSTSEVVDFHSTLLDIAVWADGK